MNPIILYRNIFDSDTLAVTSTASGYDKDNLKDFRSYTKWKASSTAAQYITAQVGSTSYLTSLAGSSIKALDGSYIKSLKQAGEYMPDCIGIFNHNLFTIGADITIEYSSNGTDFTALESFKVSSDNILLKTINESGESGSYWRIKLSGMSAVPEIGILMLGTRLDFPWPPVSPVANQETIRLSSEYSEAGHLLGSVIAHYPKTIPHKWTKFTRSWLDGYFQPFWDSHAKLLRPFFYAWDLINRPGDVFFVHIDPEMLYQVPFSTLNYGDELQLNMKGVSV